jgi:hypothetical protein
MRSFSFSSSTFLRTVLPLAALAVLPVVAHAEQPARDPQIQRLLDAKSTLKWNQAVGSSKERYGHAEALVDAPADVVAEKASDYAHYKDLHRKFSTARVINKDSGNTDVYMRYPVQIGPFTFNMHEVMRFTPVHATLSGGPGFQLEAHGIQGDMKQGHTLITIKPVDAHHSLLQVDVLLVPSIPAPQTFIDEELRDGAQDFVNGLKDRSQGWVGPVTTL